MKKIVSIILVVSFICLLNVRSFANTSKGGVGLLPDSSLQLSHNTFSVYLCEATTGQVLYANNEFSGASPASVTKIMTLLLVMEALEGNKYSLDDVVTVSGKAASMGGSQVFLEEGERITVEELIKSAVIASGNDASVALAELTAGSEASFVKMMNSRAQELGLKNTNFENCTGLDDTTVNHYTCAADIATVSRELIKHDLILKYSSIWQDTIRNGEFTLTNTNRLIRYYAGCNGLKTGSTDKAGFCISTTAKRENMQLIAVVMGAETRDIRNTIAKELLDYGFANYALYSQDQKLIEEADVLRGVKDRVPLYSEGFSMVLDKALMPKIEILYEIPESIVAPLNEGEKVGRVIYKCDGEQLGYSDIIVGESIDQISYFGILLRIVKRIVMG